MTPDDRFPLSATLAAWACDLDITVVPVRSVSRHLLDALGCALAAARTDAATPALAVAARDGDGPCRVPGTALRLPAPAAALATGVLIHALDFDDTHAAGLVHASAPVIAAALAVGQECHCDGAQLLTAIAVGTETICRLGAAVPHGFHRRGFHATSVCGTPAAALVAALLMGLDRTATAHAIGIAVSLSSGSLEFLADGSTTKQLHPGLAAQAGVTAARLAAAGATGPARSLEGSRGLFALFTDGPSDVASVTEGLGDRWECEQVTIKPYPACQLVHASLDAVATLPADVQADDVDRIECTVPADAVDVVCEPLAVKRRPRTAYDAKFSLPWTVATMVVDRRVTVDSFADAQLDRPAVLRLADRVVHVVSPDRVTPAAAAPGHVDVRLRDGRRLTGKVSASVGGPANPLSEADLERKLIANLADETQADRLRQSVMSLPQASEIDQLVDVTGSRSPALAGRHDDTSDETDQDHRR